MKEEIVLLDTLSFPNTGGKPNAKPIKGRKINTGLDDGMSGWHHTERDENRS